MNSMSGEDDEEMADKRRLDETDQSRREFAWVEQDRAGQDRTDQETERT